MICEQEESSGKKKEGKRATQIDTGLQGKRLTLFAVVIGVTPRSAEIKTRVELVATTVTTTDTTTDDHNYTAAIDGRVYVSGCVGGVCVMVVVGAVTGGSATL